MRNWLCVLCLLPVACASNLEFSLQNAAGKTYTAADVRQHKATVLLFVATDCPNSNTYAPLMARLQGEYAQRGVLFLNVYSDPQETAATVRKHDADFQIPIPGLLDPRQTLARETGARSTPEAVILGPDGKELYRGRVDDRFVEYGKTRYQASDETLRKALDQILQGQPVTPSVTRVVGCAIPGVSE